MINYFVTAEHTYPITPFLSYWQTDLGCEFRLMIYEEIFSLLSQSKPIELPGGTFVFTDLDRLTPAQLAFADEIAMAATASGMPVLNRPAKVLTRFELLRSLHDCGINRFNVYRTNETPLRYPVFIRRDNHSTDVSKLLNSQTQLEELLVRFRQSGGRDEDLMVVEYEHVGNLAGLAHKFGTFLIGNTFVPRHLMFSRNWFVKQSEVVKPPLVETEKAFLNASPHPHEPLIRRVFGLANIEYGRIDYSASPAGGIQIWEINTNPEIIYLPNKIHNDKLPLQPSIMDKIAQAFRSMNTSSDRPVLVSPSSGCVSVARTTACAN